jgi:serine/threonine-protein kinase
MTSSTLGAPDPILALAVKRGILNVSDCERIAREAERRHVDSTDIALEECLLHPTQIELLQALARPDRFIPGYEILDFLGAGAVGVVYRARQLRLDRVVALKTVNLCRFDRTCAGRSQFEAKVVGKLSHPNIVTAYDYGLHDGRVYLAMELLEGETLEDRIDRDGPLQERLAWGIVRQVAAGLAHAAEHGIVHRDIKPANIVLVRSQAGMESLPDVPLAKITDFGLALQVDGLELTRITLSGTLLGTLAYAAPEQLDKSDVDHRADIYALGASLFHMLTGERPYSTATSFSSLIVSKQTGGEAWRDQLPELSATTIELLRDMTAHNTADRPTDYRQLIQRIDAILQSAIAPLPCVANEPRLRGVRQSLLSKTLDLPSVGAADRRPPTAKRTPPHFRSKAAWTALFFLGTMIVVVTPLLVARPLATKPPAMQRTMLVPSGARQALFNGQSVPIGSQRGSWQATKAKDGGRVLAGANGWLDLALPSRSSAGPPKNFRLRLGINALQDAEAELHFGRAADRKGAELRFVIRLAKGLLHVGQRSGVDAPFVPLIGSRPLPAHPQSDDLPVYQDVQLERHQDGWIVQVNGVQVASIHSELRQDLSNVLLVARQGTAHFADLEINDLVQRIDQSHFHKGF